MLRATLIDAAIAIVAILAGLPWGVTGVAASIAIAGLLVRLPVAFWLATRRGPVSMGHILTAIAPAACAAHCRRCRYRGAAPPRFRRCRRRPWRPCCWSVPADWPPSGLPCWPGRRPVASLRDTFTTFRRPAGLFSWLRPAYAVAVESETHGRGHRTAGAKDAWPEQNRASRLLRSPVSVRALARAWRGADMRYGISFSPRIWGPRATRGDCRATPPIFRSKRSRSAGRIPSKISFAGARRTSFMVSSPAGGSRLLRPM